MDVWIGVQMTWVWEDLGSSCRGLSTQNHQNHPKIHYNLGLEFGVFGHVTSLKGNYKYQCMHSSGWDFVGILKGT